jgi:hypothetical protein
MNKYRDAALAEWNLQQPAWTPIKRYDQLTAAQQSRVDERADELEFNHLMVTTADSVARMDC